MNLTMKVDKYAHYDHRTKKWLGTHFGTNTKLSLVQTSQRAGEVDEERVRRSMEDPEIRVLMLNEIIMSKKTN